MRNPRTKTWNSVTALLVSFVLGLTMLGISQPSFSVDGDDASSVGMQVDDAAASAADESEPLAGMFRAGECTPGSDPVLHNLTDGDVSMEILDRRADASNEETIKTEAITDNVAQRWSGEGYGQKFGISNTTTTDDRTFRVYFAFENAKSNETAAPYVVSGDSGTRLEVGKTYYQLQEAKKNEYSFHKADGDGTVYYIEVPAAKVGETFSLDVRGVYPPESAGGTVKSWVEELTASELAERGNTAGEPACGVHEARWNVDRTTYEAKKQILDSTTQAATSAERNTWGEPTDPKLAYNTTTGKYYITNLRYVIENQRDKLAGNVDENGAWNKTLGEDPAIEMVYEDVFTVPEGFEINPEIIKKFGSNLSGGSKWNGTGFGWFSGDNYPGQSNGYSYFATLIAQNTPVLTVLTGGYYQENENLRYEISSDHRTIKISWTHRQNNPATRDKGPALRIKFADNVLLWSGEGAPDENFNAEVANHFTATTKYRHSSERTTNADVTAPIVADGARPKVSKSHDEAKTYYRGDPIDFTISAENEGTAPWKINEGREDEGKIVDALPGAFYVTPSQMLAMFKADGGNGLVITAKNVQVCTATVSGRTGTSGDEVTPSPQTSDDCATSVPATFTVQKNSDGTLAVSRDGGAATNVQATEQALATALGQVIVTADSRYTLAWSIPDGSVYGGQKVTRVVKATVKDQFMAGDFEEGDATNKIYLGKDLPDQAQIENAFGVDKRASITGEHIVLDGVEIPVGTVVDYSLVLERKGGQATYDAVPLIDDLSGAQVLLAEVALNKDALEGKGLETMDVDGVQYYVLDKPGTYEGVRFSAKEQTPTTSTEKTFLADRVVIEDLGDAGLKTSTYWYMTSQDFKNPSTVTVAYKAITSPERAGYKTAGSGNPAISNGVYLHPWRKYNRDGKSFNLSKLGSDKHIVTDKRVVSDLTDDAMVRQSKVDQGQSVTYRLALSKFGDEPFEVTGKDIYDALPKSVAGKPWSTANVSLEFPTQPALKVTSGSLDAWRITDANPVDGTTDATQQYIVWGDDLKLSLTGSAYFYATLTFPSDSDWETYQNTYGAQNLYNTWYVKDAKSQVSHYLEGEQKATLQKGVTATGTYATVESFTSICHTTEGGGESCSSSYSPTEQALTPDETEAGRTYYSAQDGYVMYYAVLHNDGKARLYINDLEDVLPEGFVLGGSDSTKYFVRSSGALVFPTEQARLESWRWLADASKVPVNITGSASTPKTATITASADANNPRKVTFHVDNSQEGSNLAFDKVQGKYYLNAGETLAFQYFALTKDKDQLKNLATNWLGMPHDAGMDTPLTVNPDVAITSKPFAKNPLNDGSRDVVDGAAATELGMSGKDGEQWLVSDVNVQRSTFVPGVSKQVTAKTSLGTTQKDPDYAGYEDVLEWTVTGHNDSTVPITDYIISDVLDQHYEFTGDVKFSTATAGGSPSPSGEDAKLFTFGEWTKDSSGKLQSVKITYTAPYFRETTTTLTVDGPAQVLKYSPFYMHQQMYVSLSSTPDGGVRLDVRAPVDSGGVRPPGGGNAFSGMPIEPGGKAILVVSGKRKADAGQDYRVAFNSGYLTPLDTSWDPNKVVHGSVTTQDVKAAEKYFGYDSTGKPTTSPKVYKDQPAVQAVASIPIADDVFTSSIERVREVADTTNEATSVSSPNYITLPAKESVFRYEMEVTNKKKEPIKKMVLINNLPEPGDGYTFATAPERLSEFQTDFYDKLDLKVEILDANGKVVGTVDPSKYKVEYSDQTTFTDADWSGTAADAWGTSQQGKRSMRIVLDDPSSVIPGNTTLRVSFNSKIPEESDAKPGEIAWNTFGYRYLAPGSSDLMLSSIPLKVGVRIPVVPTLAKKLVDDKGELRIAAADSSYSFLVYSGKALTPAELDGKSLGEVLTAQGRQVGLITRSVKKGEQASGALSIAPGVTYSYDAATDTWQPTQTKWEWKDKTQYTIVEIGASDGSELARFEQAVPESDPIVSGNHTSFTFTTTSNLAFTAVNRTSGWAATLHKLNGDRCTSSTVCDPLGGAVFGIYTPNKAEVPAGFDSGDYPSQITNSATTYYLFKTVTTGEDGHAVIDNLKEQRYVVRELAAPQGFELDAKDIVITEPQPGAADPVVTVKNYSITTLPESGGDGFRLGYALAFMLMTAAAGGLWWRRRWVR